MGKGKSVAVGLGVGGTVSVGMVVALVVGVEGAGIGFWMTAVGCGTAVGLAGTYISRMVVCGLTHEAVSKVVNKKVAVR